MTLSLKIVGGAVWRLRIHIKIHALLFQNYTNGWLPSDCIGTFPFQKKKKKKKLPPLFAKANK
jgi:hypothetical protein